MGWLEMIERGQKKIPSTGIVVEKKNSQHRGGAGRLGGMGARWIETGRIETRQPVILKKYVNTCLDAQERRKG